MNLKLPKEWKAVKLDDALDYVIGGDWGKDENFEDETYDFAYCIRGSEIKNWEEEKGSTATLRKIKITNIEKRKLQEGDILVEISGGGPEQPVGRTVLIDKASLRLNPNVPKICTNFLRLMRPIKEYDSKFLNLYLKLFYYSGEIVKYQGGSNNLRNLKFPDFVKIIVPLPPLSTQQAIVSKIEELFSELDNGIANLKTAQLQLKTYRQSVLKWAFEGKLTNKKVKDGELPKGWELLELKDIVSLSTEKHKPTKTENLFYVGLEHIEKHTGKLTSTVGSEKITTIKNKFNAGDILYGKLRPNLNKCYLAKEDGVCSTDILVLKLSSQCLGKYLHPIMVSTAFVNEMSENTSGVNLPRVPTKFILEYKIPLPPVEEQNRIINELESRLSVADKMEESITQSLQQAEALRQSILKKAFEGKLI